MIRASTTRILVTSKGTGGHIQTAAQSPSDGGVSRRENPLNPFLRL